MKKELLTGNEAIARGAWEAGIHVATGYPGTPSTEILEALVHYPDIQCQWSTNEKVAAEVAIGASIGGARSLVTMKHVGLNVAADPMFSFAYTGVHGGMVFITADEPSMHSSQNEQDNRQYARSAKLGLLEPSDSQECKDFVMAALDLSERFNLPFLLRTTTRISHSKSSVTLEERSNPGVRPYQKEPRFITMPAQARLLRQDLEQRLQDLREYAETSPLNRIEWGDASLGIITSGMCYQHVKEALPQASVLKIGLSFPLPLTLIAEFASKVDRLVVIEELDPYMEEQIKAAGIACEGKELMPRMYEISPNIIRKAFEHPIAEAIVPQNAPPRPPVLCPGCPHRSVFYLLGKLGCTVMGDIGCYTLGALAPLNAIDTTVCMGAAFPMALGMEKAHPEMARKLVAVNGDSTFLHTGIAGLIDMVYNGATSVAMILDNSITAMTGHQPNPASGAHMDRSPATKVNFAPICAALGVKRIREVDAYDLGALEETLKEELAAPELSVIIVHRACALIVREPHKPLHVDSAKCVGCTMCTKIGCPALSLEDKKAVITSDLCVGCNVCAQLCHFNAISAITTVKEEV